MTEAIHIPVLCEAVVEGLNIQPDDIVLDGTLGFSGHASQLISSLSSKGLYIGIDRDEEALAYSRERLGSNPSFKSFHTTYSRFPEILAQEHLKGFDKGLVDLGVSSRQIDHGPRGFSFTKEGPLDMRMNRDDRLTAAEILASYSEDDLTRIFVEYGEIFKPFKLVRHIIDIRKHSPILTTMDLVALIKKSFYFNNQRSQFLKSCALVFQALRMEVNQELQELETFLNHIPTWLNPGGRLAVITFHSLEDRMVKFFFKENKTWLTPVGKKVIAPTYAQAGENPRSKSAKLRIVQRL
jgi:16S rRNA (cytosine1402-N4)-methyltransferase